MQHRHGPWRARISLAALALCLAPAGWAAQDDGSEEPSARLERVKETLEQKQKEIFEKFEKTEDEAERQKLFAEYRALLQQSVDEAVVVADLAIGTETAAEAWAFVLQNAAPAERRELAGKALVALVERHLASAVWDDLGPMLERLPDMGVEAPAFERSMRALMEKAPAKGVRAGAMFALGAFLAKEQEPTRRAEGLAMLRRMPQEFAGVAEAKDYLDQVEATLFQLEKLQPGMPCPDFEATDAAGAKFKLSDYKGKVVLIDFWGYW